MTGANLADGGAPAAPADENPVYRNYWRRKQMMQGGIPPLPIRYWWPGDGLCDIERAYFRAIEGAQSLLDVGAGDLRVMRKLQAAGYAGLYHTQDIGHEYAYDYRDLGEVRRSYDAILCLDVIEHLELADGLGLIVRMVDLLAPGGVLILQTPNARCIRDPMTWDMTHVQCYNAIDLYSYLACLDLEVQGYRISLQREQPTRLAHLRQLPARYVTVKLLGCDYADNLGMVARKPAATAARPT